MLTPKQEHRNALVRVLSEHGALKDGRAGAWHAPSMMGSLKEKGHDHILYQDCKCARRVVK